MDIAYSQVLNLSGRLQVQGRDLRWGLAEARPIVQVVFLLRFLSGTLLCAGLGGVIAPRVATGALAWFSATFSVYLYNGVCDIRGDRINGSTRPIASGRLGLDTARSLVIHFAGLSLALSAGLGPAAVGVAVAMLTLGWLYSAPRTALKNTTRGAGAVVFLMGLLTYMAGFVSAGGGRPSLALLVFAMAMSLWMGLVGAVVKDFSDPAGDRAVGRRTLVAAGNERPARLCASVSAVGIGAVLLVAAATEPVLRAPAALTATGGVAVAALCLVPAISRWLERLNSGMGEGSVARIPYRAFMVTQYAAHASLAMALMVG